MAEDEIVKTIFFISLFHLLLRKGLKYVFFLHKIVKNMVEDEMNKKKYFIYLFHLLLHKGLKYGFFFT